MRNVSLVMLCARHDRMSVSRLKKKSVCLKLRSCHGLLLVGEMLVLITFVSVRAVRMTGKH